MHAQEERDSSDRDARRVAHARVGVETGRVDADDSALVVVPAQPHEDAGLAAPERVRRMAGVLERFPGHLEQEALLGVETHRLTA